jgi:hypothetical protein
MRHGRGARPGVRLDSKGKARFTWTTARSLLRGMDEPQLPGPDVRFSSVPETGKHTLRGSPGQACRPRPGR